MASSVSTKAEKGKDFPPGWPMIGGGESFMRIIPFRHACWHTWTFLDLYTAVKTFRFFVFLVILCSGPCTERRVCFWFPVQNIVLDTWETQYTPSCDACSKIKCLLVFMNAFMLYDKKNPFPDWFTLLRKTRENWVKMPKQAKSH